MSYNFNSFKLKLKPVPQLFTLQHEVDRNQELLGQIKKLKDRESDAAKNLSEQVEANRALCKNLEGLHKKLEERDTRLNTANQVHTLSLTHTCNAFVALVMSLTLLWLSSLIYS